MGENITKKKILNVLETIIKFYHKYIFNYKTIIGLTIFVIVVGLTEYYIKYGF